MTQDEAKFPEADGTGNYRPVISAKVRTTEHGPKPTLVITVNPTRVPRQTGDDLPTALTRYCYDVARSLGKETGIDMNQHTGVNNGRFKFAHMPGKEPGTRTIVIGINPETTGGHEEALAITQNLVDTLNQRIQEQTERPGHQH